MAASRHVLGASRKIGGGGAVVIPELTVADFQVNPATGTCGNPEHINDNDTVSTTDFTEEGQYAEIDLGSSFKMKQVRSYGRSLMVGDGRFDILYYDGAWHDWITDVPVNLLDTWSEWEDIGEVTGSKIKILCTVVDAFVAGSLVREYEVKY